MKKLKIHDPELYKILINKMLEKHNIDFDYIMANQQINGKVWCTHYEWTQEESDNYKKWFIEFFQKNISPRYSNKFINHEYLYWNLQYGLKIKEWE